MDYGGMTQEELDKIIVEKFGNDWTLKDLEQDPDLYDAYIATIETGM